MKLHEKIPLSKSGLISPIVSDYLQSDSFLKDFYHFSPNDKGIEEAIYSRKFAKENRTILVHTLQNDYKVLGINDSIAQKQMELLKQENTFTVTTGHQLCVFGGPLFFFYKIASTIKLAQELSQKYPDKNFIPFFWLASEDHDFEEVNHLYYKQEKYTWQQNTNSFPVGKLLLRESFHDFFNAIKKATQGAYFEEDFAKKIFDAYATSETLAEATIKLVHAVFGDLGLLCIDADNKQFKKALVPVMLKDILEQQCYNSLKETNTILKKKYKAQINGREINFFHLSDKGRNLIVKKDNAFIVQHTQLSFSHEEMTEEIENHPEVFSPNVVLRPVYQEMVLPNIAYIGGPGEVAYWLQLKNVFELNNLKMPVVLLRNSFLILSHQQLKKIENSKLPLLSYFKNPSQFESDFRIRLREVNFDSVKSEIADKLQLLINQTEVYDNNTSSEILKLKLHMQDELSRVNKKLNKTLFAINESKFLKAKTVKLQIMPDNTPQERHDSVFDFFNQHIMLNSIMSMIDATVPSLLVVTQ